MLNPDQVLFLSATISVISYIDIVWRRRRKETFEEGQKDWKFSAMWEDFKDRKHIRAKNGGPH